MENTPILNNSSRLKYQYSGKSGKYTIYYFAKSRKLYTFNPKGKCVGVADAPSPGLFKYWLERLTGISDINLVASRNTGSPFAIGDEVQQINHPSRRGKVVGYIPERRSVIIQSKDDYLVTGVTTDDRFYNNVFAIYEEHLTFS